MFDNRLTTPSRNGTVLVVGMTGMFTFMRQKWPSMYGLKTSKIVIIKKKKKEDLHEKDIWGIMLESFCSMKKI